MIDPRIAEGVKLVPKLQRLMKAATATPWGNRGKLSDRIVGPDEKTIAEFVSQALGKDGDEQDEANAIFCTFIVNNFQTIIAALTAAGEMERELAEAREALKPIAELFADAQGRLTPDYGEVTGRDFQMMTMHPDPEGLASDLRRAARALSGKGE